MFEYHLTADISQKYIFYIISIMYNPVSHIPQKVTVSIEIVIYFPNCILTYSFKTMSTEKWLLLFR